MYKTKRTKSNKTWIPIVLILIVIGGAAGYYYWSQASSQSASTANKGTMKTSTVRNGSIVLSVTGTGTSSANQKATLSFTASGTVAKVNAAIGDKVTKGAVLAELGDTATIKANVTSANLDVLTAQKAVDDLNAAGPTNIANARLALVEAQKTYDDARSAVVKQGQQRCDDTSTTAYYEAYLKTKNTYDALDKTNNNNDYYLKYVVPAKKSMDQAYATYMYCLGYTDYEIASSQATLTVAELSLTKAQTTLDTLIKNNGVDPLTLAQAQNKVATAQIALEKAQKVLDGVVLTAPFDGTILTVAGKAGDTADTSAFITMADLQHPLVDFYVDETDIEKVTVGESVEVTFDINTSKTYTGKITRMSPTIETVSGYQVVRGQIQLTLSGTDATSSFPEGLNASVDVIYQQAQNAVLAPNESVRSLGNNEYGVFVVDQSGKLRFKQVTIGLKNATFTEIKSGLSVGDVVTTGLSETN